MFYVIVLVFLSAGILPFVREYQARHDPALGPWFQLLKPSLLTLDNALALLLIAIAVGLLLRRAWARTLAVSVLLAWLVKYALLIVVGVLFLEMVGGYAVLGLLLAGRLLGSMGDPGAPAATREGIGSLLSVMAHPILSRVFILVAGGTVILLLHWAYRYLRDDDAVEWEFGPATLFGRSLRLRGRDLTIPVLAGAYLVLPFLPLLGRLPALRALRPESRRAAQLEKEAEEREKKDWIVDLDFSADLQSMMVFSAKKGAVRVELESANLRPLDPAVFSYARVGAPAYVGSGKGAPEKIHSRVSPDHEWFLNQQDEIVSVRDGTRRPLRLERPLGRPVLFLDAKQLLTLTPEGEFLWVELDPERVTYVAAAPGGLGGELLNRVPLMEVSRTRNALYYEVGKGHYVFDLEAGEGSRVEADAEDARFQAFSVEGDTVCLRVRRSGGREEIVLVDVKSGTSRSVPWLGTVVHLSSANNLVLAEHLGVLRGYSFASPETELWQSPAPEKDPYRLEATGDGGFLLGALVSKRQLLFSPLYPLTGPAGWQTLRLSAVPDKSEFPRFEIDPTSQAVAFGFGLKVQVFWIRDLASGARLRTYDLEDAW